MDLFHLYEINEVKKIFDKGEELEKISLETLVQLIKEKLSVEIKIIVTNIWYSINNIIK